MKKTKGNEVLKMRIFKAFIKSLIENIDRGMTLQELRKFLVELLE